MTGFEARQDTPAVSKSFIRARQTANRDKAFEQAGKVIADWHTYRIKTALAKEFRLTSRIVLRRPWWMPSRLYMGLLRSIIIEQRPIEERDRHG